MFFSLGCRRGVLLGLWRSLMLWLRLLLTLRLRFRLALLGLRSSLALLWLCLMLWLRFRLPLLLRRSLTRLWCWLLMLPRRLAFRQRRSLMLWLRLALLLFCLPRRLLGPSSANRLIPIRHILLHLVLVLLVYLILVHLSLVRRMHLILFRHGTGRLAHVSRLRRIRMRLLCIALQSGGLIVCLHLCWHPDVTISGKRLAARHMFRMTMI